jgi:hypothetical protein
LARAPRARAGAARDQARRGRSRRQLLRDAAFSGLLAEVAAMPVIEQATGIIMARRRCGPQEAAALLRQASGRAQLTVPELAAQIVEQTTAGGEGGNVTPISMGALPYLRSRTRARPPVG